MKTETELRPLYLVDALAKGVGEEVTYVYDDIAFISHSEVLIQFTDTPENLLHLFIHHEIDDEDFASKKAKYEIVARGQSTMLIYKGRFAMEAKTDSEEIDLKFFLEGARPIDS